MSVFRRTNPGISNMHRFYDVDFVVFLEGGKNCYSKSECYNGSFNDDTPDIHYWSRVFTKHKPSKKFKFKSVGSKKTILEIVHDIIHSNIKNICAGMDNEFDEILNKRIIHPRVFYTNGYSFENDVWNLKTIIDIIQTTTASNSIDKILLEKIYKDFLKKIKSAVFGDAYQFFKGNSFFPRKTGLLFCVDNLNSSTKFPVINQTKIDKKLNEKGLIKSTVMNYGYKNRIDSLKLCFGHFLADFCCQIIQYYLKLKHSLSCPSKEVLYRMAIKHFFDNQYISSNVEIHHNQQFARE